MLIATLQVAVQQMMMKKMEFHFNSPPDKVQLEFGGIKISGQFAIQSLWLTIHTVNLIS